MNFGDWYSVKLLYKITIYKKPCPKRIKLFGKFYSSKNKQFFEESIVLIHADSFEQAYKFAEKKAQKFIPAFFKKIRKKG